MSYYTEVYSKRLNRYGNDYQTRIQNQRERVFEDKLLKSVYRVDFEYKGELQCGTLERFRQDETQTLQFLLTRVSLKLSNGDILMIPDKDGQDCPWMVYWLEDIRASGYNKYIVLKMTHFISWTDNEGQLRQSYAYMYGQEDNMLKDEIRSRSRMEALYAENLKLSFFIMPRNAFIKKDNYIEIGEDPFKEGYRVTGYDIQSTPGVEYVTVDPVYLRDHSKTPEPQPEDNLDDYYWLQGGDK